MRKIAHLLFMAVACLMAGAGETSFAANSLLAQAPASSLVVNQLPTKEYFSLRRDFRRCATPLCGGYWVTKLNKSYQRCPDGSIAKECYVWDVQLPDAADKSLVEDSSVVSHGRYVQETAEQFTQTMYKLVVDSAYKPVLAKQKGSIFAVVHDSGLVCVTAPCSSVNVSPLNRNANFAVSNVKFIKAFSAEQIAEIQAGVAAKGFILSGRIVPATVNKTKTLVWETKNAYRPLFSEAQQCGGLLGLSCASGYYCNFGATCGAADQLGTCERRAEACAKIYDPVCGCDGHTYSNSCSASSAGVSVVHTGACN